MKERIQEFLKAENKSSAQLAEEIGVQPSGISHIISGRNNPSLDFVLKMLDRYKYLSTEWLLFGIGTMYKDLQMQNLFDNDVASVKNERVNPLISENLNQTIDAQDINIAKERTDSTSKSMKDGLNVVKIVWFYNDNSFEQYYPRR
jgi:transcriptional regulator with XRE-family HTH domain